MKKNAGGGRERDRVRREEQTNEEVKKGGIRK